MGKIIVEIFSLLIILSLFSNYHKQYKNKNSINKKLFYFFKMSLLLMVFTSILIKSIDNNLVQNYIYYFLYLILLDQAFIISIYINNKFLINLFNFNTKSILRLFGCYVFLASLIIFYPKMGLIISVVPLLVNMIYCINKKNKNKVDCSFILYLLLIIIISQIIDYIYYGFNFTVIAYTVVHLLLYIHKINKEIYVDYLTGIYNRKILQTGIYNNLLENNNYVGIYLIDLNKFKKINDTHGHQVGDDVLKTTAQILKNTMRQTDYVIRLGGDEFLIIAGLKKKSDLEFVYKRIITHFDEYNKINKIKIGISIGYDFYLNEKQDFKQLLDSIDEKMYKNKTEK